jgi:hypothetical protein
MNRRDSLLWAGLVLTLAAGIAQASTSATGTNTVAPGLKVSVNVQTAVELTLATGSGGCTISAGGGSDYSMSFSNINGLGVGTPSCGVVASVTASNATYATTYQITASYSGFGTLSGPTIVETTPGFTHSSVLTLGEASSSAGPFTTIPSSGTAVTIAAPTSGAAINRALAVTVSNANGASGFPGSGSGADSAIITFTPTVQ